MNSVIADLLPMASFEAVRDQIVLIIKAEFEKQRDLATGQLRDWYDTFFDGSGIKIYVERGTQLDSSELNAINVFFATENIGTGTVLAVDGAVKIAVDVIGSAWCSSTMGGDEKAARVVQRVAGVLRRILMHPSYVLLAMPGVVKGRKVSSVSMGDPSAFKDAGYTIGCGLVVDVTVSEKLGTTVAGEVCESSMLTVDCDTGRLQIKGNSL